MDSLSDAPLELSLAVLALLDGLSIGTLLIPVFLLLAPRLRGDRVLLYLLTIAGFYLLVGVLFTLGMVNLVDVGQSFLNSTAGLVLRLVVGVVLLVAAFAMSTRAKGRTPGATSVAATAGGGDGEGDRSQHVGEQGERGRTQPGIVETSRAVPASGPAPDGRISRWRERLLSDAASPVNVMAVALAAGLVEVATMLPYLVAMGMVAEADLAMPLRFAALAAYCVVMIAPALVLLALRVFAAPIVQRPLERLAAWLQRTAAENTAWIVGIIGFLIARSAASELGVFETIGELTRR